MRVKNSANQYSTALYNTRYCKRLCNIHSFILLIFEHLVYSKHDDIGARENGPIIFCG